MYFISNSLFSSNAQAEKIVNWLLEKVWLSELLKQLIIELDALNNRDLQNSDVFDVD